MIEVLGTNVVAAALARIGLEVHEAAESGIEDGADKIRAAWVDNIVGENLILTGRYRDSVHVERDGPVVGVLTDVPYASILEFGDSRQAAHPVAERAFDEHHKDVTGVVTERVQAVVR